MNGVHIDMGRAGDEDRTCCFGSSVVGRCTCWEAEYDREQAPIDRNAAVEIRPGGPCSDCGCKADQPEASLVASLADTGTPFYCHEGMRRKLADVHPDGSRIESGPADYQPLIDHEIGLPFRANGQPAYLCAGWAARTKKAAREQGFALPLVMPTEGKP